MKIKKILATLTSSLFLFSSVNSTAFADELDVSINHLTGSLLIDEGISFESDSNIWIFGDINKDGSVNIFDTNMIIQFINGSGTLTASQQEYADLDANGIINEDDIQIITYIYIETNSDYVNSCKEAWYKKYFDDELKFNINGEIICYGDINGDGYANAWDLSMINQFINGTGTLTERQQEYADLNADGVIDERDSDIRPVRKP